MIIDSYKMTGNNKKLPLTVRKRHLTNRKWQLQRKMMFLFWHNFVIDWYWFSQVHGLPSSSSFSMSAFNGPPERRTEASDRIRERRLANLLKVEENLTKGAYKREKKTYYLGVYVLDISRVLENPPVATWQPPKNLKNGPEETILYTLVKGKSELVMFGGIQKDANSIGFSKNLSSQISNSLHFITAPSYVI